MCSQKEIPTPFTVKHFLLEYTDFADKRLFRFQVNNLKDLFKDVPVGNILPFVRHVNLFNKIYSTKKLRKLCLSAYCNKSSIK